MGINTWGGTTIPAPTGYSRQNDFVGVQYILSDGSLQTDSVTSKVVVSLEWANVTETEKNVLVGKAYTFTASALVIEEEASESVIPVAGSLSWSRLPGGSRIYTVSCQVRTV